MDDQDKKKPWLNSIVIQEELAGSRKINDWLLPLLHTNLVNKPLKNIKLLSVGCGFGADVDCLADAGIDAYGIEPFERTEMWDRRKHKERLKVADGRELPFDNETFDVIYCSEVLEHVGYDEVNNMNHAEVINAYKVKLIQSKKATVNPIWKERVKFAKELTRVLKPHGIIIITTPNRHFCIDIGHWSNFFGLRIHSPFHDFTPSINDIKKLFLLECGCREIFTLHYKNFITWDVWTQDYPIMRFLQYFIRTYFFFLDRFSFLRSTFLSPQLILAIRK